jgi:hypothetical protein
MFVNDEFAIASFSMNKCHMYGDFLSLNMPSLRASVQAVHVRKTPFVLACVLSSLLQVFSCHHAEAWKFKTDISRTLRYNPQHKDADAVDPGQIGLASHAMRLTLQINLRSVLDRPDHCDVVDGFNEEAVFVLSESGRGDMETHHDMSSRPCDSLNRTAEKVSSVPMDAESGLAVFSRVVQSPCVERCQFYISNI